MWNDDEVGLTGAKDRTREISTETRKNYGKQQEYENMRRKLGLEKISWICNFSPNDCAGDRPRGIEWRSGQLDMHLSDRKSTVFLAADTAPFEAYPQVVEQDGAEVLVRNANIIL